MIKKQLVTKSDVCFRPIRRRFRRTNTRISRGNTAHETNRVSPRHIESIGLLYFDKSHVPCGGVRKEWGFTSIPQEKKRGGAIRRKFIEYKLQLMVQPLAY